MITKTTLRRIENIILLLCIIGYQSCFTQNLIVNGSFENVTGTTCNTGMSGCVSVPTSCYFCNTTGLFLPSWSLDAGNIDRFQSGADASSNFYSGVPHGSFGIDLNGSNPGTISQVVSGISIGGSYTFSIGMSNNMGGASNGCTQNKPFQVNIYNSSNALIASQIFNTTGLSTVTNTWSTGNFTFTATTSTLKVEIKSIFGDATTNATCGYGVPGIGSFYGPSVDNVSLILNPSNLPIELISFDTQLINKNSIKLSWKTNSEINTALFIVEESQNGVNWSEIGSLLGKGTSSQINSYDLIDSRIEIGTNYYRLIQIDMDGNKTVFPPTSVEIEQSETFSITPNPSNDGVFIIGAQSTEEFEWYVTDSQGRKIQSGNYETMVNISEFSNGIYYLEIKSFGQPFLKKIVKN